MHLSLIHLKNGTFSEVCLCRRWEVMTRVVWYCCLVHTATVILPQNHGGRGDSDKSSDVISRSLMKTSCVLSWSSCSFLAHLRLSLRASISSPTSCCSKACWLSDSAISPYKYQWSMSTIRAAGCAAVGRKGLHWEEISATAKMMTQSQNKLYGPECWVCMITLAKFLNQKFMSIFFFSFALWRSSLLSGCV